MATRPLLLLCAGLAWVGCSASDTLLHDDDKVYAEAEVTLSRPAPTDHALRVEAINGSVDVTGADTEVISLTALRRVGAASLDEAEAALEDLRVVVDTSDAGVLTLRTEQPVAAGSLDYIVLYDLRVPLGTSVVVHQANGSVTLEGLTADVLVSCANGTVAVHACGGNVDAQVANGTIDARLEPGPDTRVSLGVANGEIDLTLADGTSAQLSADVANGSISVHLPMSITTQTGESLRGVIGDGAGSVVVSVGNGRIDISDP